MAEVCERIRAAIASGRRITVHGDYDVDGVCSTAIVVRAVRELGGECDWLIPGRQEDGYGLTKATVERLAARGTSLLVTTDCGIGSVAEVDAAIAAGLEVIVTDHHQPGAELPACPILHPGARRLPVRRALRHRSRLQARGRPSGRRGDRGRARPGRPGNGRRPRPPAGREPGSGAPRARGRPRRPPTRDPGADRRLLAGARAPRRGRLRLSPRAAHQRRRAPVSRRRRGRADADHGPGARRPRSPPSSSAPTTSAARSSARCSPPPRAAAASCPTELAEAAGLVLAGEGWHPGVVGIVASRLVERHHRPVIVDRARRRTAAAAARAAACRASTCSRALRACDAHLARYGGHRAAAGLEIEPGKLAALPSGLRRALRVRARRRALAAGRDRRRGRRRREPRPRCRRAAHAARAVRQRQPWGQAAGAGRQRQRRAADGRGRPARAVHDHQRVAAGARGRLRRQRLARPRDRRGAGRRLGEPRAQRVERRGRAAGRARRGLSARGRRGAERRRRADRRRGVLAPPPARARARARRLATAGDRRPPAGERVERRSASATAAIAALASSGETVLALCADAIRRRELVEGAARPARFGGGELAIVSTRLSDSAVAAAEGRVIAAGAGVVLADWAALARNPRLADRLSPRGRRSTRRRSPISSGWPRRGRAICTCSAIEPRAEFALSRARRRVAVPRARWPPSTGPSGPARRAGSIQLRRASCSAARAAPTRTRPRWPLARPGSWPSSSSCAGRVRGQIARSASYPRLAPIWSDPRRFVAYRDRYEEGRRYLSERRQT